MKNIEKYMRKNAEKMNCTPSSVNIETKHHDFIVKNNLNLSAMVRDMLDAIMAEKPEQPSKKRTA